MVLANPTWNQEISFEPKAAEMHTQCMQINLSRAKQENLGIFLIFLARVFGFFALSRSHTRHLANFRCLFFFFFFFFLFHALELAGVDSLSLMLITPNDNDDDAQVMCMSWIFLCTLVCFFFAFPSREWTGAVRHGKWEFWVTCNHVFKKEAVEWRN